jgi:hypothetical protein
MFVFVCLIVVPLAPGKNPFAVKLNNNNNNNVHEEMSYSFEHSDRQLVHGAVADPSFGCTSTCNSLCLSGYGLTGLAYSSGSGANGHSAHGSTSYGPPTAPSDLYGAPFKLLARGSSGNSAPPTSKSSPSSEYPIAR